MGIKMEPVITIDQINAIEVGFDNILVGEWIDTETVLALCAAARDGVALRAALIAIIGKYPDMPEIQSERKTGLRVSYRELRMARRALAGEDVK
jgi:hypothetical protein